MAQEGKRERGLRKVERQGAQRCAPVLILYVLRMVLRSGLVRQCDGFASDRHIQCDD